MSNADLHVGSPRSRVDGPLKVTGQARYAAEFAAPGLLHGVIVSSAVTRGGSCASTPPRRSRWPAWSRCSRMRTGRRRPGSTATTATRPRLRARRSGRSTTMRSPSPARRSPSWWRTLRDRPLRRHAGPGRLRAEEHVTDLELQREEAYTPPKKRNGVKPPPKPRGDADAALAAAPVKLQNEYSVAIEHHNPMEPARHHGGVGGRRQAHHPRQDAGRRRTASPTWPASSGCPARTCGSSRPSSAAPSGRACGRSTSSSSPSWRRWS